MNAAAWSDDHYAQIPSEIIMSSISSTAFRLWSKLALYASRQKPEVWVRQANLAESLKCSTDTVGRAIKELLAYGFLHETPRLHRGLYKTYRLHWFCDRAGKVNQTTLRKNAVPPTARVRNDDPQICGTMNRAASTDQKTDHFFSNDAKALVEKFGEEWQRRFPCLDGLSGRPSLLQIVEIALHHKTRQNYNNDKVFLDGWLMTATSKWIYLYNREQNASPTDPALDDNAKRRRAEAERLERQERIEKSELVRKELLVKEQAKLKVEIPEPEPETPEEREWIVAQIRVENERDKRKLEYDRAKATRASWFKGKEKEEASEAELDLPITKENYPLRWPFLRQRWAMNGKLN